MAPKKLVPKKLAAIALVTGATAAISAAGSSGVALAQPLGAIIPCQTIGTTPAMAGPGAFMGTYVSNCLGNGRFQVSTLPLIFNGPNSFQSGPFARQLVSSTPATQTTRVTGQVIGFDGIWGTCYQPTVNVAVNRISGAVITSQIPDPVGIPCVG